jgi:hypothetical protein
VRRRGFRRCISFPFDVLLLLLLLPLLLLLLPLPLLLLFPLLLLLLPFFVIRCMQLQCVLVTVYYYGASHNLLLPNFEFNPFSR